MIRVIVGVTAGICAGLIAPAVGQWVTGIRVTLFTEAKGRRLFRFEVVGVTTIYCAIFVSISTAIEGWFVVVAGWILSLGLLTASWIDAHTHRLPRNLSYSTFGAGVPLLIIAAMAADDLSRLVSSVIGVVVATGLIGFLYLIGRGAMGTGDIRLAPVIGLYTGWISVGTVVLALGASFFLAAIFALVLLVLGRANRRDEIPLGPFLAFGTISAFVYAAANYGL